MVIKRIEPLQCAKVVGTLYAMLGLLAGIIFSLIAATGGFSGMAGLPFAALFGVGAVILLPLIYGCFGFVFSLIAAAIYNLVAKLVGGFQIQVE